MNKQAWITAGAAAIVLAVGGAGVALASPAEHAALSPLGLPTSSASPTPGDDDTATPTPTPISTGTPTPTPTSTSTAAHNAGAAALIAGKGVSVVRVHHSGSSDHAWEIWVKRADGTIVKVKLATDLSVVRIEVLGTGVTADHVGQSDDSTTHEAGDDNGTDDPATHDVGDDDGSDDPATHDVGDDNGGASNSGSDDSGSDSSNSGSGSSSSGSGSDGSDDNGGHGGHGSDD